eukprot:1262999-Rhodomonas_salina.1
MVNSSQGRWYATPATVLRSRLWVAGTTLPPCSVPHWCLRVAGERPLRTVPVRVSGSLASSSLTPRGR